MSDKGSRCRGATDEDVRCSRRAIRGTRYCWQHTDLRGSGSILTAGSFVAGVLLTLAVTWYSERGPHLTAECRTGKPRHEASTTCVVKNDGWKEARDVRVVFRDSLPYGTVIRSESAVGAELESGTRTGGGIGGHLGFSVVLPIVVVDRPYEFELATQDPVNVRAAKHLWSIFGAMAVVQGRFTTLVGARYGPESIADTVAPDLLLEGLRSIHATLYRPFVVVYGDTPESVSTSTQEASATVRTLDERRRKYLDEWNTTMLNAPSFLTPVISIATESGFRHQLMTPVFPGLSTCPAGVRFKNGKGQNTTVAVLPESYDEINCDGTTDGFKVLSNAEIRDRLNGWPPTGSDIGPAADEESR